MILLFGQHPTGATADRQYPLHARVGSVGDVVPPVSPPSTARGGGAFGGVYIRRQEILKSPPHLDEDLILALAALTLLETENQS